MKKFTIQITQTRQATVVVKASNVEELRATLQDGEAMDGLLRQLSSRTKHVQTTELVGEVLTGLSPDTTHDAYHDAHDSAIYLND